MLTLIKKMAFNAFTGINVTEAVIFRQIDKGSNTAIFDEYEKAGAGIHEAITQVLNSGFYKEISKVPRNTKVKDGDFEVTTFDTFSPKVISRN